MLAPVATRARTPVRAVPVPRSWTIKQLKMHLMLNHPDKPGVGEQKLVHGGKLLDDKIKLAEVFDQVEKGDTQVSTPRTPPFTPVLRPLSPARPLPSVLLLFILFLLLRLFNCVRGRPRAVPSFPHASPTHPPPTAHRLPYSIAARSRR